MKTQQAMNRVSKTTDDRLAIDGGTPVRTEPLALEFPGVHYIDEDEIEAAVRLLRSRSLFRYYGVNLQKEVDMFEEEFSKHLGVRYTRAVSSGTGALQTALAALAVGPGPGGDHPGLYVGVCTGRGGQPRSHSRAGGY